jgi:hypothetical protein
MDMQQSAVHEAPDPQAAIAVPKQPVGLELQSGRKGYASVFPFRSFVTPLCLAIKIPPSSLSASA